MLRRLCASLALALALLAPAPALAAPASHSPPFLSYARLRYLTMRYWEDFDVRMASIPIHTYVLSCAKLTRNSGACSVEQFLYSPPRAICDGRLQITLSPPVGLRTQNWIPRPYGFRCES